MLVIDVWEFWYSGWLMIVNCKGGGVIITVVEKSESQIWSK